MLTCTFLFIHIFVQFGKTCVMQFQPSLIVQGFVFVALFCLACKALKNLTVEEGQAVGLFFAPLPKDVLASSSFKGCRFKKNGILFAVWHNGAESGICKIPMICQRIKYQLNGSLPWMKIPRPTVNDSGRYSIECKSYGSTKAKDHGEEILLHVVKDPEKSLDSNSTGTSTSIATPIEATIYAAKPKPETSNRSTIVDVVISLTVVPTVLVILIGNL